MRANKISPMLNLPQKRPLLSVVDTQKFPAARLDLQTLRRSIGGEPAKFCLPSMFAKKTPEMTTTQEVGEWKMIPSFHRPKGFDTSKYEPPMKR